MPQMTKEEKDIKHEKKEKSNSKKTVNQMKKKEVTSTKPKEKAATKKQTNSKKREKKETSAKKAVSSSKVAKKAISQKTSSPSIKPVPTEKFTIAEYYDLPTSYQKTVVKILAQTPTTLFIYWEISNDDKEKWEAQYGKDFMAKTKPVLIVHNETTGSSFEVEIHDFANSWYLHVPNSDSYYHIELGRRLKQPQDNTISLPHNYLYVSASNEIESPNDHILLGTLQENISYRNVKTNTVTSQKSSDLLLKNKSGNSLSLCKLYEKLYQTDDISHFYDLTNPSSQNPTSTFH